MRKATTAWKPPPRVLTMVRVEGSIGGPTVTFCSRPHAYGYRLTIWTRGEPSRDLVDLAKAMNAHLRQGRTPRTCPAWLALGDWVADNMLADRDVRLFQEVDASSGRSRPRPRPRPRP